jgi:hypothetical protein
MAWRFVRQPNGLLSVFSDIVDNFTHCNLTRENAIEVAMHEHGMGEREAEEKVERGLKDEIPWKSGVYGDGTARWRDCLKTVELIHGKAARDEIEAEILEPS